MLVEFRTSRIVKMQVMDFGKVSVTDKRGSDGRPERTRSSTTARTRHPHRSWLQGCGPPPAISATLSVCATGAQSQAP
jgi:hypothetical protein